MAYLYDKPELFAFYINKWYYIRTRQRYISFKFKFIIKLKWTNNINIAKIVLVVIFYLIINYLFLLWTYLNIFVTNYILILFVSVNLRLEHHRLPILA